MRLVASVTANYVARAASFFESLPLIRSMPVSVILLDFNNDTDPNGKIEHNLRLSMGHYVDFQNMFLPKTASHYMIQDSFLDAFPDVVNDELVILTDADGTYQRDFSDTELQWMDRLEDNDIGVYWNCGPSDTLQAEADRIELSPQLGWKYEVSLSSRLSDWHCFNCGLMIARASTYRRIQKEYASLCEEFYANTPHRSRCQFLLNYCWHRLGVNVEILPHTFHQHAHLRDCEGHILLSAPDAEVRWKTVCVGGTPVVFRHHFPF